MEVISHSRLIEDTNNDNGIYAKLKRLKIQEEILTASANCNKKICTEDETDNTRYNYQLDLRKYISNIKKTYIEIKNLFGDIKIITTNQEHLKNTDINEIKRDIFKLDEKIKSFKDFISKELCVLKVAEKELLLQINENQSSLKQKKIARTHSKPHYNEVVPSPVRAIINTSFKCVEVQRFQEFMKNSCNRYGGWDEYNHNIFVHIWNKHFSDDKIGIAFILEHAAFQDEVLQKILGVNKEDVKSHSEWYFQYLHLKQCQEVALNKWRENKRKIRKPKETHKEDENQTKRLSNISSKLCKNISNSAEQRKKNISQAAELAAMEEVFRDLNLRDDSSEVLDVNFILDHVSQNQKLFKSTQDANRKETSSTLYKPTTQWKNRCQARNDSISAYNIDDIKKLKTPLWRVELKQ